MANPWDNDPVVGGYVNAASAAPASPSFAPWENDAIVQAPPSGDVSTNNVVRSVGTGVPVIGGLLNRMDALTNAAVAPAINPMLSDQNKLQGDSFWDRYNNSLAQQQGMDQAYSTEHPIANTVGNVVGGVAGTIPAIMATPTAFGAGGGNLLIRSAIAGGTGAGIGGADAAVRSDGDPAAIASGMKWGGFAGSAGPITGRLVGNGVRAVNDYVANRSASAAAQMEPQAFTYLRRALTDDGIDATSLPQRLDLMGPDAMLADLGPNLQKQAGALAATPGRAQEIVRTALADRQAGANARLGTTINDTLGPNVVPSEIQNGIADSQNVVAQGYGPVMANATAVNTQPIADNLDAAATNLRGPAQQAVQRVRGYLNIPGAMLDGQPVLDPNPQALLATRQAIDGLVSGETNPQVVRQLTMARQQVDGALADAAPGVKDVDAQYSELGRQSAALQRGQTVLDSGRTAPRPTELADEMQTGALPQGTQIGPSAVPLRLAQGARGEVERIVGTNANDINAINNLIKGEGDWNRNRLSTLFGPDNTSRLFDTLGNERTYADTANTVTRNSESAARLAAQAELGGIGRSGFGAREAFKADGLKGVARSFVMDKADKLVQALLSSDTGSATRESLGSALVGQQRDRLVQALTRAQGMGQTPALVQPLVKALLLNGAATRSR
ncbi:hypothetical protein [Rhizobium sp. L245/93]|uniref:hypothetical protein n=1 Tax=Rhizobium sp. L245/93 TaxID=2819998 RepID=UPI001ADB543B|nr:hypothetical protein [Rhizobium sp. L245/93]MBO9168350.1 hypothetical protein [Rhizobium sp. L245/93]